MTLRPPPPAMTPATEAVYWRVRSLIETARLEPGERIGTERDLADRIGAGRNLLRQALEVMEREGSVRRIIGRAGGIVVSDGKVERPLNCTASLPSMLRRQGFVAETRMLDAALTVGDASISRSLGVEPGDSLVRIRRVRLADGEPLSLEITYLPSARFPRLLAQPLDGSLYDLMRDAYGITPTRADERVEGRLSTDEEVTALELDGAEVVLEIRRTAREETGRPVEFATEVFRAGRTRIRRVEGAAVGDRSPRVADPVRRTRRA